MNVSMSDLWAAGPVALACAWAMLVLVVETFASSPRFRGVAWLSIVGLALVAGLSCGSSDAGVFGGGLALDGYAGFFNMLFCGLGIVTVLYSVDHVPEVGIRNGEYYPLLLFTVAGSVAMAAAVDLIVLFLALETLSMAVYVLAGIRQHDARSNEASIKYFLVGAFASALLLYGIALIYLQTGSVGLDGMAAAVSAAADRSAADLAVLRLAVGLLLLGFAFKIAAVPFHLWAPDVYEGAPATVTAFMATVVKAAAFAGLMRVALVGVAPVLPDLAVLLWVVAAATMTVGNVVALRQTSFKRMLAYSSIAHTGYLLVGVTAATAEAGAAVLFYLAAYGAMNMAAFGVLLVLARVGREYDDLQDFAGLGHSRPLLGLALAVAMLSLLGIPPLSGFVGKIYIFSAALAAGYPGLVVVAVVNTLISAAYYIGVIRILYFEESAGHEIAVGGHAAVGLALATAATVGLGLAPASVLGAAKAAVSGLLPPG